MNEATILRKQETVNEIASHIKEAKSMVIVAVCG